MGRRRELVTRCLQRKSYVVKANNLKSTSDTGETKVRISISLQCHNDAAELFIKPCVLFCFRLGSSAGVLVRWFLTAVKTLLWKLISSLAFCIYKPYGVFLVIPGWSKKACFFYTYYNTDIHQNVKFMF